MLSVFKTDNSTEIDLSMVLHDLETVADTGAVWLWVLLDLPAAFDTVDHTILLSKLEISVYVIVSLYSWVYFLAIRGYVRIYCRWKKKLCR